MEEKALAARPRRGPDLQRPWGHPAQRQVAFLHLILAKAERQGSAFLEIILQPCHLLSGLVSGDYGWSALLYHKEIIQKCRQILLIRHAFARALATIRGVGSPDLRTWSGGREGSELVKTGMWCKV